MSKCPTPFENIGSSTCVMPCPTDRNFERVNDNGQYKCVYKPDPTYSVNLQTIGAVDFTGSTIDDLQAVFPGAATQFGREKLYVEGEIASKYRSINESQRVTDAFKALQDAQNAQDEAPEAYQAARVNYYTLVFGEGWKEKEKTRLAKTEVDPVVKNYKNTFQDLKTRLDSQRTTIDVVDNLKDNVLTLKDDFQYSVNTFSEQLEKLRSQINMDRRDRVKHSDKDDIWKWADTAMNLLIVIGLFVAIWIAYSRWWKYTHAQTIRPPVAYTLRPGVY